MYDNPASLEWGPSNFSDTTLLNHLRSNSIHKTRSPSPKPMGIGRRASIFGPANAVDIQLPLGITQTRVSTPNSNDATSLDNSSELIQSSIP